MKIIQAVPHVGNEASGPTYSVVRLAQTLAQAGNDVLLLSTKDGFLPESLRFKHQIFPTSKFPDTLWRSPGLYRALQAEGLNSDFIHSHSMWVMPNVYPGWVSRLKSIPLVVSPRGTMSSWALSNSAIKKAIVLASVSEKGC